MLVAGLFPLWSYGQTELIIVERTSIVVQTGADTLVPFGDYYNNEFGKNYASWLEMFPGGETIANATVTGPNGTQSLPYDAFDESYLIDTEFDTEGEMSSAVPAGTYTFTGTGSVTGAISESLSVPAYSAPAQLKVTNFAELQSFDVNQDLVIQWEPFTEGLGEGPNGGYAGLIDLEVTGYSEDSFFTAWWIGDAPAEDLGDFGLLPTVNSVTIPSFMLSNNYVYIVNIYFARIDEWGETAFGGLKAVVTGYELELNIYQQGIDPPKTDWALWPIVYDGPLQYVDTTPWLGWIVTNDAPWIYSLSLDKYVFVEEEWVTSGGSWVYIPSN